MSAGNNITDECGLISTRAIKPVSVRALADFGAKSGSLDRRFTPGPSALEGIEGHKQVTLRRPRHYQTEVSLKINYQDLLIRGRADGYDDVKNCLEEIKTFYGEFDRIPENHRILHWAQAKLYGWMLCTEKNLDSIQLALVYFHLDDQKEYRLE